jgi:hypothetical protein
VWPTRPASSAPAASGQRARERALVVGLVQPDLHQLVVEERLVERAHERVADPARAHVHHGPQIVRQRAEPAPLAPGERGHPRAHSASSARATTLSARIGFTPSKIGSTWASTT